MLYRFAFALGLLLLGIHFGREISRVRPARVRSKSSRRSAETARLYIAPVGKASVH